MYTEEIGWSREIDCMPVNIVEFGIRGQKGTSMSHAIAQNESVHAGKETNNVAVKTHLVMVFHFYEVNDLYRLKNCDNHGGICGYFEMERMY